MKIFQKIVAVVKLVHRAHGRVLSCNRFGTEHYGKRARAHVCPGRFRHGGVVLRSARAVLFRPLCKVHPVAFCQMRDTRCFGDGGVCDLIRACRRETAKQHGVYRFGGVLHRRRRGAGDTRSIRFGGRARKRKKRIIQMYKTKSLGYAEVFFILCFLPRLRQIRPLRGQPRRMSCPPSRY